MRRLIYLTLQSTREGAAGHTHVFEIIKGLRKRGWVVTLHSPQYPRKIAKPHMLRRFIQFGFVQLRFLRDYKKASAVYMRSHFALFPAALFCRCRGIPFIQEVNGPYEDLFIAWPVMRKLGRLIRWMMKTQYAWADRLITVTPNLAEWLIKEGARKPVFVIPNGANVDLFQPDASRPAKMATPYAVFFGALTLWQGVETMLSAVESRQWPDKLMLVIAGDGSERSRVEAFCRRNKKVVYLGRLPHKALPGLVAGSIIGLSPQNNIFGRSETGLFPLKVFEMLACGVPVIVTDFPGQADLIRQHRCGLVVPPDDPDALARGVSYLYHQSDERREMSKRGRDAAVRHHSWDKRAGDTEKVILSLRQGACFASTVDHIS